MLIFEGFSEMGLFRNLTDHVFCSSKFPKYISNEVRVIVFLKCAKFDVNVKSLAKDCEKMFCFLDKRILIDCGKFSLLRR